MNLSRVAVKQLTTSDLTFFSAHYHQQGQRSKQKAINLNADVFVSKFYPGLRNHLAELHFGLTIFGPGNAKAYRLSRKALRTHGAKNWRLDGELVNDPPDEPGRFDDLTEGDYALLAFEGADQPEMVTLVLVSLVQDTRLHQAISRVSELDNRQSMQAISAYVLRDLHASTVTAYQDGHPLETLLAADSIEEAIHGTSEFQNRVAKSNDGKGVAISPESIRRQAATASEIGQLGEEAFERWLIDTGHPEDDFEWISNTHARAAYDFLVTSPRWETVRDPLYVDVKSTKGLHDAGIHMSMAEVRWAAQHEGYRIARVSSLTETSAQIRVLTGISRICLELLKGVQNTLPDGVAIDSLEFDPGMLHQITNDTIQWSEIIDDPD